MDQRVALIADYLRGEWSMTELATRYRVVRKTVYKWVARYLADPEHGLAERSRAPHGHGRAMAADLRAAVLALRRQHPTWGPKKLRAVLAGRLAGVTTRNTTHDCPLVTGHTTATTSGCPFLALGPLVLCPLGAHATTLPG